MNWEAAGGDGLALRQGQELVCVRVWSVHVVPVWWGWEGRIINGMLQLEIKCWNPLPSHFLIVLTPALLWHKYKGIVYWP